MNDVISQILQQMRKNPQDQNPAPSLPQEYLPQPGLEAQAQMAGQPALNPMVAWINQHLGLLNLMRNRNNQELVDVNKAGQF